jgi:hypothetical protein
MHLHMFFAYERTQIILPRANELLGLMCTQYITTYTHTKKLTPSSNGYWLIITVCNTSRIYFVVKNFTSESIHVMHVCGSLQTARAAGMSNGPFGEHSYAWNG